MTGKMNRKWERPKKEPAPRKSPAGRKPFDVTDEKRQQVRLLAAMRVPEYVIAERVGCSDKTLRLRFAAELEAANAHMMADAMEMLLVSAKGGNVAAQRALIDELKRAKAKEMFDGHRPDEPVKSTDKRVSKKQERQDAARRVMTGEASGDWGADLKPGVARPN